MNESSALSDSEGESNEASDDEEALLEATIILTQITCNCKSACKHVRCPCKASDTKRSSNCGCDHSRCTNK